MERDRRVPAPRKRCLLGFAALLAAGACQRSSLATPTRAPIIDLTANRQVVGIAETRRILFGAGDRSQLLDGWSVDERAVMPDELADANEVFLCGSAAEIVPVGAIDERRYQVGPMTRALIDDYARLVRQPESEGFGESAHFAAA